MYDDDDDNDDKDDGDDDYDDDNDDDDDDDDDDNEDYQNIDRDKQIQTQTTALLSFASLRNLRVKVDFKERTEMVPEVEKHCKSKILPS